MRFTNDMPHRNPGEFIYDVYALEPAGFSCRFLAKQLDVASSRLSRVPEGEAVFRLNGIAFV